MILTFPTLSAIAQALVAHRATGAKALADWERSHAEHGAALSADIATHCRRQLADIDNALLELQTVAPPFLSNFLKHQIDLIQSNATTPHTTAQEA